MLLLLVLGMLELLVVLEELVVFVGGIFKRVKITIIFLEKIIESKNKSFGTQKIKNSVRQSQKSTFTIES